MKFKSYLRAAGTISALTLAVIVASPALFAQAAPAGSPTIKPKLGHLRCWNAMPLGSPTFELTLASDPNSALQGASPQNLHAPYVAMPPGQYGLRVVRAGDRQNALKSFNLPLRDKSYLTLFITQGADGQPAFEMLDDTPDPTKPSPNRLTVRQFCQGATAIISAGGQRTQSLAYGGVETLENLPNGVVPVAMKAILPSGGTKIWNSEADFRASHRATIFIIQDQYKRMRLRVTIDGPSPEQEAEDAAEIAAANHRTP